MERPAKCLVHLRTTESVKVRGLFETLNPILIEGNIEFNEKGMVIQGINLIILCDMIIRAEDVEDYVCNANQRISINFDTLHQCLSSVGQDEAICFQITEASINAMVPYMSVFIMNNSAGDEYVFAYKVTLLALEKESFEVPATDFRSVVSIPSSSFQRVLRCCEKSGSFVQITTRNQAVDQNYIIFTTTGDVADLSFHMKYQVDAKTWTDTSCPKLDRYSLKYISLITKATSLSNFVTLYLAPSFVLAVRYNIGTIGEITFCLAPQFDQAISVPGPIIPINNIFADIIGDDDEEDEKKQETGEIVTREKINHEAKKKEKSTPPKRAQKLKMVDDGTKPRRKRRKRRKVDKGAKTKTIVDYTADASIMSGHNMKGLNEKTINEVLLCGPIAEVNSLMKLSTNNLPSADLSIPSL